MPNAVARTVKYFFANMSPLKTVKNIKFETYPVDDNLCHYTIYGGDCYNFLKLKFQAAPFTISYTGGYEKVYTPQEFFTTTLQVTRLLKDLKRKNYTLDYIDEFYVNQLYKDSKDLDIQTLNYLYEKFYKASQEKKPLKSLIFTQDMSLYSVNACYNIYKMGLSGKNYPIIYHSLEDKVVLELFMSANHREDYYTYNYYSAIKLEEPFKVVFDLRSTVFCTLRRHNEEGFVTLNQMEEGLPWIQTPTICYYANESILPLAVEVHQMFAPWTQDRHSSIYYGLIRE